MQINVVVDFPKNNPEGKCTDDKSRWSVNCENALLLCEQVQDYWVNTSWEEGLNDANNGEERLALG